jgi:hypothetical protein
MSGGGLFALVEPAANSMYVCLRASNKTRLHPELGRCLLMKRRIHLNSKLLSSGFKPLTAELNKCQGAAKNTSPGVTDKFGKYLSKGSKTRDE